MKCEKRTVRTNTREETGFWRPWNAYLYVQIKLFCSQRVQNHCAKSRQLCLRVRVLKKKETPQIQALFPAWVKIPISLPISSWLFCPIKIGSVKSVTKISLPNCHPTFNNRLLQPTHPVFFKNAKICIQFWKNRELKWWTKAGPEGGGTGKWVTRYTDTNSYYTGFGKQNTNLYLCYRLQKGHRRRRNANQAKSHSEKQPATTHKNKQN